MTIPMFDLHRQYTTLKTELDEALGDVMSSMDFIKGQAVTRFEKQLQDYLHIKHVIGVGNGTDALYLALLATHIGVGDEVIVPAFTFVSPVEAIVRVGATPIFVDIDPHTFNIDAREIEPHITPHTKAIIPVHLFGQCADMTTIVTLAQKYHLVVIEDACQVMGALHNGRHAGTFGDIGCTSFFPTKTLGCYGDGGAVFTSDDVLAEEVRMLAQHGMRQKYHYEKIGINSRLDTIQATILEVKLRHLEQHIEQRITIAKQYDELLWGNKHIILPTCVERDRHVYHQYTIQLVDVNRDVVREKMLRRGVTTMVYYPTPIHLQPAYHFLGYTKGSLPITESMCDRVLSLPIFPEMSCEEVKYVCKTLLEVL